MAARPSKPASLGRVYLLHFERPLAHAQHYLGWTEDVAARVARHLSGEGSPLVRAVAAEGIGVQVARAWLRVPRAFERQLKRHHNTPRLCPLCRDRVRSPEAVNG